MAITTTSLPFVRVMYHATKPGVRSAWSFGSTGDGSYMGCNHYAGPSRRVRSGLTRRGLENLLQWFQRQGWEDTAR